MNHYRRMCQFLAVSVLLLSGVRLFAAVPQPMPQRPTQTQLSAQAKLQSWLITQTDTNDEVRARVEAAALAPAKFDRDGNGRFDDAELNAWLGAVRTAAMKSENAMQRYDANRDGKLDDAEWSVVVQALVGKA
ncbi:hypothetical protein [Oleiharenicola lentus]|uniref:hypothetical protein n=1 Tax=Oleiharenicola lentus TaxID=2508720 RepID=UPI003F67EAFD